MYKDINFDRIDLANRVKYTEINIMFILPPT